MFIYIGGFFYSLEPIFLQHLMFERHIQVMGLSVWISLTMIAI